jgi:very-short-patch-repair endonuclease
MNSTANGRRLRRGQTSEEKEMWRALRAGRFAGFKFRRQHPLGSYFLDFYCPAAKLSIELDGFTHGTSKQKQHDEERSLLLRKSGIEELRFWNRQWRKNRDGILLGIWNTLHRKTGCTTVLRKTQNNRYVPPDRKQLSMSPLNGKPNGTSSPHPSPPF